MFKKIFRLYSVILLPFWLSCLSLIVPEAFYILPESWAPISPLFVVSAAIAHSGEILLGFIWVLGLVSNTLGGFLNEYYSCTWFLLFGASTSKAPKSECSVPVFFVCQQVDSVVPSFSEVKSNFSGILAFTQELHF